MNINEMFRHIEDKHGYDYPFEDDDEYYPRETCISTKSKISFWRKVIRFCKFKKETKE